MRNLSSDPPRVATRLGQSRFPEPRCVSERLPAGYVLLALGARFARVSKPTPRATQALPLPGASSLEVYGSEAFKTTAQGLLCSRKRAQRQENPGSFGRSAEAVLIAVLAAVTGESRCHVPAVLVFTSLEEDSLLSRDDLTNVRSDEGHEYLTERANCAGCLHAAEIRKGSQRADPEMKG